MFKPIAFFLVFSLYLIAPAASANIHKPVVVSVDLITDDPVDNMIDRAYELLGTPYRQGGISDTQGFDCSGFLVYLFKTEANIHIPRTTAAMQRSTAATVKRSALQPGDAVFFRGNGRGQVNHVGLYIGEGKFIHSPRSGKSVRIDSLANQYWSRHYSTARRFH